MNLRRKKKKAQGESCFILIEKSEGCEDKDSIYGSKYLQKLK